MLNNDNNNQSSSGNLRQEKNKARNISFHRRLGANMYQTGKKRESEGKIGGAFLTNSGRMINRAGQEEDKTKSGLRKTAETLINPKKAVEKVSRTGSRSALRWAWKTTFGISYINIHAFGRFFFPKLICPLGEEWTRGAGGKTINYAIGWGEIILLVFLDVILAFLIVLVFLMIYIILHPIKTFWDTIDIGL